MKKAVLSGLFMLSAVGVVQAESLTSGSDLNVSTKHFSSAAVGRDLLLDSVQVDGHLMAGRNLTCSDCTIGGNAIAGHDIALERCEQVKSIISGHDTSLLSAQVLTTLSAQHNVSMDDVTIATGLQAGNEVSARRSNIKGPLVLGGHTLRLDRSKAETIRFASSSNANSITNGQDGSVLINSQNVAASLSGNTFNATPDQETIPPSLHQGILINGSANHAHIVNSGVVVGSNLIASTGSNISAATVGLGRGAHISVGSSGVSSVNGYTVQGSAQQTTVITPDQCIYVNGRLVSGQGPATYGDYTGSHPGALQVQGPGWSQAMNSVTTITATASTTQNAAAQTGDSSTNASVVNVLELVNNSTVNGNVVFESGFGEIRVEKGSQFNGKVENGHVVRL